MKQITLYKLNELYACSDAKEWFVEQDTTSIKELYELAKRDDHLDWANWLITKLMTRAHCVQYAIFAAESVLYIYEDQYPEDDRPRTAIAAAKEYLAGDSSAADAAAVRAADAAAYAAYDAAVRAADAAAYAAYAAADAAADAAYAAADAADAAARAVAARAADAAARAVAARAAAADHKAVMIHIIDYGLKLLSGES